MDAARYQRLRSLLHEAAGRPTAERRAWLAAQAPDDPMVVEEVLNLLEGVGVATRNLAPADLPAAGASLHLAPGTLLGRHRIRSEIGRGGMGVVYEASDAVTGEVAAVKVVLPHLLTIPSVRERFLREARLGLTIAHENVVRTLALEEARVGERTLHCLVMERVRGRTLRRFLDETGPVPEALWREIGAQAARGLAAIHEAGAVHRDIKPENLLLDDDRRVRVMDLGVAKVSSIGPSLTTDGNFVGSLHYAAPEQCRGENVGPPADLYALGVVLHELATGHPPFEATDPVGLLRAHMDAAPPSLGERAPAYSEFAAGVVGTLLAKRPDDRFLSARDLAHALAEGESSEWWSARRVAGPPAAGRARRRPPLPPMVARSKEREALMAAWAAAKRGAGAVALVVGEAGLGKSRLAEEVAGAASDEGAVVLRTSLRPDEGPARMAAALAEALGPAGPAAEAARRLGVGPEIGTAWAAWVNGREPAPGSAPLSPAAADGLTARLLASLSAQTPVLWAVEDADAADADARRELLSAARAAAGQRALVLVTTTAALGPATLASLALQPGTIRVDLSRLDEHGVAALAASVLGDATLGLHLAPHLLRLSDGVPLFVLETLRDLERRGHLVRRPDGSFARGAPLDDLEPPRALADLVRGRLASLAADERATLDAAAVVGLEFDPHLVAAARGRPRIEVLDALGRLERARGLVKSGPRLCRFDHPLVREILESDLPAVLAAELHARVADAIEAARPGPGGEGERAWRIALHRLRGPDPASALPAALVGAQWCEEASRNADTLDLVRRALAASDASDARTRVGLLLRAARAVVNLGRAPEAFGPLDEALALAEALGDAGLIAAVRMQRGHRDLRTGRFREALAEGRLAAEGFRACARPAEEVSALGIAGKALWCLGQLDEARALHEQALRKARALGEPFQVGRVTSDLAVVLEELGYFDEAENRLREALALLSGGSDRSSRAVVEVNLGNVLQETGRYAEALVCYEAALSTDRELGDREGEAVAWVNIGEARLRLGDLEGAREAFRLSAELAREAGSGRVEGYGLHGLGVAAWWIGDRAEGRRLLERALVLRRAIHHAPGVADSCLALGTLAAEDGAASHAAALLEEAAETAARAHNTSAEALARLRRAFLPGGDPQAARRAVAAAGERLHHHARIESRWLLWRLSGDPADRDEARRLLAAQRALAPAAARAEMAERVPLYREVVRLAP